MQTNSFRQQSTRRMTPAQKAAMHAERIEADIAANEAHLKRQREITQPCGTRRTQPATTPRSCTRSTWR